MTAVINTVSEAGKHAEKSQVAVVGDCDLSSDGLRHTDTLTLIPQVDDEELLEDGDEEEDTRLLGGGGFTPEQLAAAEARLQAEMVG